MYELGDVLQNKIRPALVLIILDLKYREYLRVLYKGGVKIADEEVLQRNWILVR